MINGIKPKMTTTTKLGIKPTSFDEAMNKFCERLTENVKPEVDRFSHMHSVRFGVGGGRKYIRVEQFQMKTNHIYYLLLNCSLLNRAFSKSQVCIYLPSFYLQNNELNHCHHQLMF